MTLYEKHLIMPQWLESRSAHLKSLDLLAMYLYIHEDLYFTDFTQDYPSEHHEFCSLYSSVVQKGSRIVYESDPRDRFMWIDNNAPVLAVFHTDTVIPRIPAPIDMKYDKKVQKITSPYLDDRLGAWVILYVLPKLLGNCTYDILITDHEEHGGSTARIFQHHINAGTFGRQDGQPLNYNWIFEFDRGQDMAGGRGGMPNDVALYSFFTKESSKLMKDNGFHPSQGSYTDICHLTGMGCLAFNFCVNYHRAHHPRSFVYLQDLWKQISRFVTFFKKYRYVHLPYNPRFKSNVNWDETDLNDLLKSDDPR